MATQSEGVGIATVTAKIGPALTATAVVLTQVSEMKFDFTNEVIQFICAQGKPIFDVTAQSTFTITVSGLTYTITVS